MNFEEFYITESREGGKKLSEYPRYQGLTKVYIYRARNKNSDELNTEDDITLSPKFAIEHAESNAIAKEEPQIVIRARVNPNDVVEAPDQGEYFYSGPTIHADVVYKTLGVDYDGEIPNITNSKPLEL